MAAQRYETDNDGLTMLEVLIGLVVVGVAALLYMRTAYPASATNKDTRRYMEATVAMTEVLDSVATLELEALDSTDQVIVTHPNGTALRVAVVQLTKSEADAILPGMNRDMLRMISVKDTASADNHLAVLVSRGRHYETSGCFSK
ncbi:MAG: prepilin-type N-terminal cleavage/methylation domain-containing protein [Chitinivibrionales bacterium]|nr:prepilin-type N-terminal cleavage/methylation domain-containing protein [Chitinivibrionales bacterium]MBD3355568.1 prepilin-type N-terminal cleavage/methylation domain-containing protein [Chitinivibrionales bacterium]